MDLNGKNVIYIGGFGGIGRHCLREFLAKGVQHLAIFDLQENAEILGDLRKSYPSAKIHFIALDITKQDNIEAAYAEAAIKLGHFDVVVNGSGLINDRLIDLTIQINLLGPIHSTLTAVKYMDKAQGGRGGLIVNISSIAGVQPTALMAVYSAAKTGVTAFTRALANPLYYQRTGIGYITICPGFTDTPLLDDPENRSTFDFETPMTKVYLALKRQTPAACAVNLVKAVEAGKNGAVWLLDLGAMEELEFPVMWKPKLDS